MAFERSTHRLRTWFYMAIAACFIALTAMSWTTTADAQSSVRPPDGATTGPATPSTAPPSRFDAEFWSKVRGHKGPDVGNVSIPDKKAAILVDNSGWTWEATRSGNYQRYGAYGLGGMVALLLLFFLIRGRIRVSEGMSGSKIARFTDLERTAHWLLAVSFIVLALSGLNLIYGRDLLMPLIGKASFAQISIWMKWAHNYVGFAFMVALVMTFTVWVSKNFPHPRDLMWLLRGGGMIGGGHPPAKKFNAGQKILFWLVMLSGVSLSLSGLALLFPYELPLFAKTFGAINSVLGTELPAQLTPNEEQQYATMWHGILAIGMTIVVIAHIYIGSIGMQGAFDAMGSGEVDLNWAKDHHSIWAEEVLERERAEITGGNVQPAE